MPTESEAVWAARLHVEKGTMLSDAAVLAICKELLRTRGYRVFARDGETVVKQRWVEDWTLIAQGHLSCACQVTSCEHDAVIRRIKTTLEQAVEKAAEEPAIWRGE
jgi:hypothetical protein